MELIRGNFNLLIWLGLRPCNTFLTYLLAGFPLVFAVLISLAIATASQARWSMGILVFR
jgi:hypothetical protein